MMDFLNPAAIYGLAALIPIVILYLLKPKPKRKDIPSLMFFWRVERSERMRSFFKRIIREPLLLLQILIIAVLVSALMTPVMDTMVRESEKEAISIVIDASASMSARTPNERFSDAVSIARDIVRSSGSEDVFNVILATNAPIVAGSDLGKEAALGVLDGIGVRETPTNLVSAMGLAGDLMKGSEHRRMHVISDFSSAAGGDPVLFAQKLAKENVSVILTKIGEPADNVAIVGGGVEKFGGCTLDLDIMNTGERKTANLLMKSSVEERGKAVELTTGINTIKEPVACSNDKLELTVRTDTSDSMDVDNWAYFVLPAKKSHNVLLIGKDDPMLFALEAMPDVSVQQKEPPTIPKFDDFETVILDKFSGKPLPGTFSDLEGFVRGGGILVVIASDRTPEFNDEWIMPVKVSDRVLGHVKTTGHSITENVDFGEVGTFKAQAKRNGTVIATVADSPFIFYERVGNGHLLYIGLLNSTFQLQPSYPIFWIQIFNWLGEATGRTEYRTGELFTGGGNEPVFLEKTGFVSVGGARLGVNLFEKDESDISESLDVEEYISESGPSSGMVPLRYDFTWLLAVFAILLILFEWRYYRVSGRL